jgi:hypothetical protein
MSNYIEAHWKPLVKNLPHSLINKGKSSEVLL